MKLKHMLVALVLTMLVTAPYLLGFYDIPGLIIAGAAGLVVGFGGWKFQRKSFTILDQNEFYLLGKTRQGVAFHSADGQPIISKIGVLLRVLDAHGVVRKVNLHPQEVNWDESSGIATIRYLSEWIEIDLEILTRTASPELEFTVSTRYREQAPARFSGPDGHILIASEGITIHFPWNLRTTALYLKNRTVTHRAGFGKIWLDKQGVSLGKKLRKFHLYHAPRISSLLYQRIPHRLTVFTDHEDDHRYHRADASEHLTYRDYSQTVMLPGEARSSKFSCFTGFAPPFQPLIWMHSQGHDATMIFTDHPDNSNLGANKAVCLGSSNLDVEAKPIGGFAKHGIPATKGVFFSTDNNQNISLFNHPDSEPYRRLTERLHNEFGFEITMHSAASHLGGRHLTEEGLSYFATHFQNNNWIDHSAHIKRECISGDGTDLNSGNYILDLLEKHGVKHTWHYGSELKYARRHDLLDDARGLDLLKTGMAGAGADHTPVYWRHPSRLNHLITWKTMVLGRLRHFPMSGIQWLAWFYQHLPGLIRRHGVCIIHDYPCWSYQKKHAQGNGIYRKNQTEDHTHYEIDPYFDHLLAHLASLNHSDVLHCTTIREFLAHQTSMEHLVFHYHNQYSLLLTNRTENQTTAILAIPSGRKIRGFRVSLKRETGAILLYQIQIDPNSAVVIHLD